MLETAETSPITHLPASSFDTGVTGLQKGAPAKFFRINPPVIRFAGFKIGVESVRKFTVLTESTVPLRMNFGGEMPPQFMMEMTKKGKIAAGLSQEVTIRFTPTDCAVHQFCVFVSTELERIALPVEAYPVMNPQLPAEFGKEIDFQTVPVESQKVIFKRLANVSDGTFNFEFGSKGALGDFKITPMKGKIEANQAVDIEFKFTPTAPKITATCVQVG